MLGFSVGFGVLEEVEEELGGLDWPTTYERQKRWTRRKCQKVRSEFREEENTGRAALRFKFEFDELIERFARILKGIH